MSLEFFALTVILMSYIKDDIVRNQVLKNIIKSIGEQNCKCFIDQRKRTLNRNKIIIIK